MSLDPEQAQPLNSRQIAKLISTIWGSFVATSDIEEVISAFNHFAEHSEKYEKYFRAIAAGDMITLQQMMSDADQGIVT